MKAGWRNNPSQLQHVAFDSETEQIAVGYRVHRRNSIEVQIGDDRHMAEVLGWDDSHVALVIDGVRRSYRILSHDAVFYVHSSLGTSDLRKVPRFPEPVREVVRGGCAAPMPGKILAVSVAPGQAVVQGDPLAILEAMKMEHEVTAPHAGVVREVRVEVGQQVDAGAILVVIQADDDTPA